MQQPAADHGMARMQELLSSYYGMNDKESEAESQRDIDSPGFDAPVYVKEMLQTMGLRDLLQKDDKLIKEIKELDTNMQMLVYENYNKFISATDTIRKMKTNVATMEREVEKVVHSMDVITDKSEIINVALAPHRSKVEKLIGVRRLLKRLAFIFELPQRLSVSLKQDDLAGATKSFLLAKRILGRYDHITSFKAIQVEAEKIVQNLKLQLHGRLVNRSLGSLQVCEALVLLSQLDACTEENKQQFLDWHQTHFEKCLQVYQSAKTSSIDDEEDSVIYCMKKLNSDVLVELAHVFTVYTQHFLPDIATVKRTGRASMLFHDDPFATFAKETFAAYLAACEAQFRRPHTDFGSLSEVQSLIAEGGDADDDDAQFSGYKRDGGDEEDYFVLMWVLKHFVAQVKQVDAIVPPCRLVTGAIQIVENCVRYQIDLVFKKLRVETLELLEKTHAQVQENTRLQLNNSARTGSGSGSGNTTSSSFQVPSVQLMAQDVASTFADMMKQVLRQMEPLVQTGASILSEMSRVFSDLVQTQFYHFLKWFNTAILTYTAPKRAFQNFQSGKANRHGDHEEDENDEVVLPWLEPTASFLLFLACFSKELASEGIRECLQVLIECLPAPSPATSAHHQQQHKQQQHSSASAKNNKTSGSMEVAHMIQVTRETSDEIVTHLAKQYGHQLTSLIRTGLFPSSSSSSYRWAERSEEPRNVDEFAVSLIEATCRFAKEIAIALGDEQSAFFPSNSTGSNGSNNSRTSSRDYRRRTSGLLKSRGPGGSSKTNSLSGSSSTTTASGMHLDIERIFANKIQIFSNQPQLTTDWFVTAMLKMAIKAFGEFLRSGMELTGFALQQVQLDAEFLRATTTALVAASSSSSSSSAASSASSASSSMMNGSDTPQQEMESLLSDVLSNARERAVHDLLMESSTIVAIVSSKSTQVLSRKF